VEAMRAGGGPTNATWLLLLEANFTAVVLNVGSISESS